MAGALPPLPFQRGDTGAEVPIHNGIIGNYMVIKIDLKQIYCRYSGVQKNPEWFSIISVIIFEVNIVDKQKQT